MRPVVASGGLKKASGEAKGDSSSLSSKSENECVPCHPAVCSVWTRLRVIESRLAAIEEACPALLGRSAE